MQLAQSARATKRLKRVHGDSTGGIIKGGQCQCNMCLETDDTPDGFLHFPCMNFTCKDCFTGSVNACEHPKKMFTECPNPDCNARELNGQDALALLRLLPADMQQTVGSWIDVELLSQDGHESFDCAQCGKTQPDLGISHGRRICQHCRFEMCPRCNKAYHPDGPCQEETPPMTNDQVLLNLLVNISQLYPLRTGMDAGEDIDRHLLLCIICKIWSVTASGCTSHRCGNPQCTRGDARCRWCNGTHHGCAYSAEHLKARPKIEGGGSQALTNLLMYFGAGDHQASRPELHARALELVGHVDDEVTRRGYIAAFVDRFNRVDNDATRARMFDEFNRRFLELAPVVHERMRLDVPAPEAPPPLAPPPLHTICAQGFSPYKVSEYIQDGPLLELPIIDMPETGVLTNPRAHPVGPNDLVLVQHNRHATDEALQSLETAQGRRDALKRPKSASRPPVLRLVRARFIRGPELTETNRRDLERLLETNTDLRSIADMEASIREVLETTGMSEDAIDARQIEEAINATRITGRRQFNRRARDAIRELIGGWQSVTIPRQFRNPPPPMAAQPAVQPVV